MCACACGCFAFVHVAGAMQSVWYPVCMCCPPALPSAAVPLASRLPVSPVLPNAFVLLHADLDVGLVVVAAPAFFLAGGNEQVVPAGDEGELGAAARTHAQPFRAREGVGCKAIGHACPGQRRQQKHNVGLFPLDTDTVPGRGNHSAATTVKKVRL